MELHLDINACFNDAHDISSTISHIAGLVLLRRPHEVMSGHITLTITLHKVRVTVRGHSPAVLCYMEN